VEPGAGREVRGLGEARPHCLNRRVNTPREWSWEGGVFKAGGIARNLGAMASYSFATFVFIVVNRNHRSVAATDWNRRPVARRSRQPHQCVRKVRLALRTTPQLPISSVSACVGNVNDLFHRLKGLVRQNLQR
jgi:hypothetical protein